MPFCDIMDLSFEVPFQNKKKRLCGRSSSQECQIVHFQQIKDVKFLKRSVLKNN